MCAKYSNISQILYCIARGNSGKRFLEKMCLSSLSYLYCNCKKHLFVTLVTFSHMKQNQLPSDKNTRVFALIIVQENVSIVLREISKFIKSLITFPVTTAEPERCVFALKKVESNLRNSVHQTRLTL